MKKMKRILPFLVVLLLLSGCSGGQSGKKTEAPLPDGTYTVNFNTDSSMFNSYNKKGKLTVKDGEMTLHVSLQSKKIVNLFSGTAEDAQKSGAKLLDPTTDKVTFDDGTEEEVYGYDVPVEKIGEDFDLALIGTKGKWYDHKVSITDPVPEKGNYTCDVTLDGGSGKASITSPAELTSDGATLTAKIVWSSENYDYMMVGDKRYDPVTTEGGPTFEIPVELDADVKVQADTTAMSEPHLIDYTLHFDGKTLKKAQ